LNQYGNTYKVPKNIVPLYYYTFHKDVLKKEKANRLRFYYYLQEKNFLYTYRNSLTTAFEKSIFYLPKRVLDRKQELKKRQAKKIQNENTKIEKGKIFMLGFDKKYMGNSKYLFNYLKTYYGPEKLKFLTTDPAVEESYKVSPNSSELEKEFYSSEFIIGESWIPLGYQKKDKQKWIQLWHGTPFKKLLFDSTELSVMLKSPAHKVNLKKDIERWDALLADSDIAIEKFATSLDFDKDKIYNLGYPRNQWLLDNDTEKMKKEIKEKLNIPITKKVVLYAPTWRDYNYKKNVVEFDTNYLMNTSKLSEYLGDDYLIIFKGHDMEASVLKNSKGTITIGEEADTQELILIADIVVTDYSSILFDAIHLETPIYLFVNDLSKYERVRGVYNDMLDDFEEYLTSSEIELAKLIQQSKVQNIPTKYQNKNLKYANQNIKKLIDSFE
ncbi:CDP-glycerol glycerophosphotransferase family protein, partial [Enterococcus saccharolyticus]|uniref:CDP-glycerol glycerophosphotransferase family protein n=1 Tax=Enterococcus saccharolyticus TaxID=41997 RepID=UPI001E4F6588